MALEMCRPPSHLGGLVNGQCGMTRAAEPTFIDKAIDRRFKRIEHARRQGSRFGSIFLQYLGDQHSVWSFESSPGVEHGISPTLFHHLDFSKT